MKYINGVLGLLFFGLAAVGAVVPVLPTTPFLLLAAFFFLRSSKRLNDWFLGTRLYKRYVATFMETRSMTLRSKFLCAAPGVIAMSVLAVFLPQLWAKVILVALVIFEIWYFIFRIKTISVEEAREQGLRRVAGEEILVLKIKLLISFDAPFMYQPNLARNLQLLSFDRQTTGLVDANFKNNARIWGLRWRSWTRPRS